MTLHEIFATIWQMLIGRVEGPLTMRLVLQPAVASFLALRAGLKDAREGRPPYLWSAFSSPVQRRDLLQQGWKNVRTVFLMAVGLDVVYQVIVYRWVYPGQAVVVATVLAIVPYVLVRGPITRLASRAGKSSRDRQDAPGSDT